MKLAAIMAVVAIAAANAQAKVETRREITVYMRDNADVSAGTSTQAQIIASGIFSSIGVKIHWRAGRPSPTDTDAIAIELAANTPAAEKPGALAYALPYEGVHIRIFWDRIENDVTPSQVLAYVMVHEITHILQGVARHSSEGIMKATWTRDDKFAMRSGRLHFTQDDVDLIYSGMDVRSAHGAKPAGRAATTAAVGQE
jgi:hypothetical protein